ncbi:MAG: hypothetical protein ACI3ZL_02805 [Candidatus Cryptobacteroides sp.]
MTTSILLIAVLAMGNPHKMLQADNDRAAVNTHIYEFNECKDTPAPKGYKPFYISHYGRHGARTDWDTGNYDFVIGTLEKCSQAGILTPAGDSLLAETRIVKEVHGGVNGHLTRRGEYEHREIARRMYARYPDIFSSSNAYMRVESSTVPRCLVSMACFIGELSKLNPSSLYFTIDSGEKQMAYIANGPTREHSLKAAPLIDSLRNTLVFDTVSLYKVLFTDPVKASDIAGDAASLQNAIWHCARVGKASGVEGNMFRYLPEEVVYGWWDFWNRELYIGHGNSVEFGDFRMPQTLPLVESMLMKADEALKNGTPAADLVFGHDHPLLALVSFFGLEGVGERVSFEEIPQKWNDPMNMPYASNLQMVFYRDRQGDILVKFVYNDRERRIIGLDSLTGPYYKWDDVRNYIIDCISRYKTN